MKNYKTLIARKLTNLLKKTVNFKLDITSRIFCQSCELNLCIFKFFRGQLLACQSELSNIQRSDKVIKKNTYSFIFKIWSNITNLVMVKLASLSDEFKASIFFGILFYFKILFIYVQTIFVVCVCVFVLLDIYFCILEKFIFVLLIAKLS